MDGGIGQDRILVSAAGGSFVLSGTSRLAGIEQIDGADVEIRGAPPPTRSTSRASAW